MTNEARITNDKTACDRALKSFNLYHLTLIISVLFGVVGCGRMVPRKPVLYCVQGRVIDAETKQGFPRARVLVRASIPTTLGPRVLSSYGLADARGVYEVELSEGFEVLREAMHIRVDASADGYLTSWAEVPVPAEKKAVYQVADIVLKKGEPPPATHVTIPGLAAPRKRPEVPLPPGRPAVPTPSSIRKQVQPTP